MCMKNSEEGCVLLAQLEAVKNDVVSLDRRMTAQEDAVAKMRSETQEGFKHGTESMREINVSVANLAHDFGQRFNNIETTVVAEKVKWGETLRWVVKVAVKVILAGTLLAMGINAIDKFFANLSHGEVSCEQQKGDT